MNYHGKQFRPISNSTNGEVSEDMIFSYFQDGDILTCQYSGSIISSGQLIGIVNQSGEINMRYQQVNRNGQLMTGICVSTPELMDNGKIRLHEKWQWTSGDLSKGESILEEI